MYFMDQQPIQNLQPETQSQKPLSKTWQIVALTVAGVLVVGGIATGSYYFWQKSASNSNQTACTMEVKQCADGSYVGRTGPNCEFAKCPDASVSPSPSVVVDETANWQTYKNEKYGFEFRYPKDYSLDLVDSRAEGGALLVMVNMVNKDNYVYGMKVDINRGAYSNMMLAEIVRKKIVEEGAFLDSRKITFVGQDAYEGISVGQGINFYEIVVKNNGNLYDLDFLSRNCEELLEPCKSSLTRDQKLILSTFKFIDKNGAATTVSPATPVSTNNSFVPAILNLKVSVDQSSLASNIAIGTTDAIFAKYFLDASKSSEDIKVTKIVVHQTVGSPDQGTAVSSLIMYDNSNPLNNGANVVTPVPNPSDPMLNDYNIFGRTFKLDKPIVISKGSQKTIILKGTALKKSMQQWGLNKYYGEVVATGVASGDVVNVDIIASDGFKINIE